MKLKMIVIIDYGLGNLGSIANALEKLNIPCKITNNIEEIRNSEKIILPGVGTFGEGIKNIRKLGLFDVLNEEVLLKKKPFLGICLGMQLLCKKGYELGEFEGFGWIDADAVKFNLEDGFRIPHIGWNDVECNVNSPIFTGGRKIQTFYFVHSYYINTKDENIIIGKCEYGINFCAAIQKDNIFAVQFHPEKSQDEGLNLLKNFAMM